MKLTEEARWGILSLVCLVITCLFAISGLGQPHELWRWVGIGIFATATLYTEVRCFRVPLDSD